MGCVGDLYFQGHSDCISNNYQKFGERQATESENLLEVGSEELSPVLSLIDTGPEVCLFNKGLIPKRFFQPAKLRLHQMGANGQVVKGGTLQSS